jgi:flagellar basal-body rod protein FlgB
MINSFVRPPTVPLLKQAAQFHERRQEVLTANIAKIDTPDYKTRDLPVEAFQEAMKKAVRQLKSPSQHTSQSISSLLPIEFPSTLMTREPAVDDLFTEELFHSQQLPAHSLGLQDNGKRNIEHEVMEMTRTLMMQSYAMQMMTSQYDLLESVISGQA